MTLSYEGLLREMELIWRGRQPWERRRVTHDDQLIVHEAVPRGQLLQWPCFVGYTRSPRPGSVITLVHPADLEDLHGTNYTRRDLAAILALGPKAFTPVDPPRYAGGVILNPTS